MKMKGIIMFLRAASFFLSGLLAFSSAASAAPEQTPALIPLSASDVSAVSPLTFEELERFSTDWTKYEKWLKKQGKNENALAYAGVTPTLDYSPAARKWIEDHDWTVDRFFFVENRIRETLSYLIKVQKRDEYARHIDEQIRTLENSSLPNKDSMIAQLRKTVERKEEYIPPKQPVSEEELALIKANVSSLTELMSR